MPMCASANSFIFVVILFLLWIAVRNAANALFSRALNCKQLLSRFVLFNTPVVFRFVCHFSLADCSLLHFVCLLILQCWCLHFFALLFSAYSCFCFSHFNLFTECFVVTIVSSIQRVIEICIFSIHVHSIWICYAVFRVGSNVVWFRDVSC